MKTVVCMLVASLLLIGGCSSGKSSFRASYDFSMVDKVAIVAVEGAVKSESAKDQIADFFGMELLDKGYPPMGRAQIRALLAAQQLESTDLMTAAGAAEAGRILNVPAVLVVSIPHFAEEVSMTAKMIDVEDGSFLWMGRGSGKSGRTLSDVFGFVPGIGGGAAADGEADETFNEVMGGVFGDTAAERALSPEEARKVQQVVRGICRSLPPRPVEEW